MDFAGLVVALGAIETHTATTVGNDEVARALGFCVGDYAVAQDPNTRLGIRARAVKLLEQLKLSPGALVVRRVQENELKASTWLRGCLILHLDLASRSTLRGDELLFTAATGRVLVAEHAELPGFPVGVTLLLPACSLPRGSEQLFSRQGAGWGGSPFTIQFALATNPGGLGAGRALCEAAAAEAQGTRFVAFAPLTGLRARIIQLVDDEAQWQSTKEAWPVDARFCLDQQVADLLSTNEMSLERLEPVFQFVSEQAESFAMSSTYRVGEFHRHLGATLTGVNVWTEPGEADAMWSRAYFEYEHSLRVQPVK